MPLPADFERMLWAAADELVDIMKLWSHSFSAAVRRLRELDS